MQAVLAQSEPVAVAASTRIRFRLRLQLLGLKPQILHDQALVDEAVEDLTESFRSEPLLNGLNLHFFHLVQGEGSHCSAQERSALEQSSAAPVLGNFAEGAESRLQQHCRVVGDSNLVECERREKGLVPRFQRLVLH